MSYLLIAFMLLSTPAYAITASWYSEESCAREGTSGIMANGEEFDDEKLTCASWDYDFGTILEVTAVKTGKTVRVIVTDRGPAKWLYARGREIDLSRKSFFQIAPLEWGVTEVTITEVK